MRNWLLVKVKYARENDQGLLKNISEQYLVDAVSPTEAEAIIYDRLASRIRGDFQVTGITNSNIVDVFLYEDSDIWHKCKISYLVADGESGKEKKVTQYMIVTANDVKEAYDRIQESLGNMLVSFRVPDIVESPIVEVFPFEKSEEELPEGNFKPLPKNESLEYIELVCETEPVDESGVKVMEFTKGNIYFFTKNDDPEGWAVLDDHKHEEVFFDPFICFKKLNHA